MSERRCAWCGGEMPSTIRSVALYCSRDCWKAMGRQRVAEKRRSPAFKAEERQRRKRYAAQPETRARLNEYARKFRSLRTYGHVVGDDPLAHTKDRYRVARALGYRSGLEVQECNKLKQLGVAFEYEPFRIPYAVAETKHYTPDILLLDNGIVIETKGRMVTSDRKKHKLIKAQYPDLEIRFVFANPNTRISKTSQTTYAKWCETNGFKFAAKTMPVEWAREPRNVKSLAIAKELMSK